MLFVAEGFVEFGTLLRCGPVRDGKRRIDLALLDALEQHRQIMLHRRLRHPEGEAAVDGRAHRNLVDEAAVGADDRQVPKLRQQWIACRSMCGASLSRSACVRSKRP
jgi:hypothetical protein